MPLMPLIPLRAVVFPSLCTRRRSNGAAPPPCCNECRAKPENKAKKGIEWGKALGSERKIMNVGHKVSANHNPQLT